MQNATNFLIYQGVWLACVIGAGSGIPWLGVAVAILALTWHWHVALRPRVELKLIAMTGLIGGLWETLLVRADWVRYQGDLPDGWTPLWIVALWLVFATTLNFSLSWLKGRYVLASALGALGGPAAWAAGEKMGALQLQHGQQSLWVIAIGWLVIMPLLIALSDWLTPRPVHGGGI